MLVRFLRNYRGYRTEERLFFAGDVGEVRANHARGLIAEGWAEAAPKAKPMKPREEVPVVSTVSGIPLIEVDGVEPYADAFKDIGVRNAFELAHASIKMLTKAQGIGEKRAAQLRQAAQDLLYPEPGTDDDMEAGADENS